MTIHMIYAAFYRGGKTFVVEKTTAQAPSKGEVAVRVAYCGICGTDMHVYHGNMDARVGLNRTVGHEMSGIIETIGEGVQNFKVGQKVVVRPLDHCGDCPACDAGHMHICHNLKFLGLDTDGAMQEIWTVPAHTLHLLPDDMSLASAALIEPFAVACHDVSLSNLQKGENAVVIGGGPIGLLVAVAARNAGGNVVISEVNAHRLKIARDLEFETVNPIEEDLGEAILTRTNKKGADVVFEVSGTQAGVDAMTKVSATRARIVMVAIHAKKPEIDLFQFFWRELQLMGARVYTPADYDRAIEVISQGGLDADKIITDITPLEDIQSAFESLDSSPTAMKSLIKIGDIT